MGQNCTRGLNCTKGQFCTKILLHEDSFACVKFLHGGSILYGSEKIYKTKTEIKNLNIN